jgi:spore maturation protein CgeB
MRLLIVGATESWSIEIHYLKYLYQMEGLVVDVVSTSDLALSYRSLTYKVINRLSPNFNPYHQAFNQLLLQRAQVFQPDVLLVFKGMEVYPQTLSQLRSGGIKLANYNPDHPFLFVGRGSGNQNVKNSVGNYDLHFCYSLLVKQRIEKEYGIPAIPLPFGFELSEEDFKKVEHEKEVMKVCFIGNPDATRIEYLQQLLKEGLPIDVYGHDWDRHFQKSNFPLLTIFPAVYGLEFWRTARKYRVQLNIFRKHNEGAHNMRTFEIPAVGGIMLAPESQDHRKFFLEGKEIFLYSSIKDAIEKAEMIMNLSYEDAILIRNNALNRSKRSEYSYQNRAVQVLNTLNQLLVVA